MLKAQQTKGLAVVLCYTVDGFDCLSNGAKIHVLMFWIFREKVCLTDAHYFIKSGKLKDRVFNSFMGLLKHVFVFFRVQNLEKLSFFKPVLAINMINLKK